MALPPRPPPPHPATPTGLLRWAYLALAGTSLALGVIGLFLPVMPTVPFILLAAWAAARSSPRLHAWLESHPRFGHHLRDWREGGVVSRNAKCMATAAMTVSALTMFVVVPNKWIPAGVALGMALVLGWLWRRPEKGARR